MQLGIPNDVNNAIFLINAYPWEDKLGVNMAVDDFSRRSGQSGQILGVAPGMIIGTSQMSQPAVPMVQQQTMHVGWGTILIIGVIIAAIIWHMNR
jgi:hypothetical protein